MISDRDLVRVAIEAGDVPECGRLLATKALGSASWLYAGVSFHDVTAPSTSNDAVAAACMELLQFGVEHESVGIVLESLSGFFLLSCGNKARINSCVAVGVVAALVAGLQIGSFWTDVQLCVDACTVVGHLAVTDAGKDACIVSNAFITIVALLAIYLDSPYVSRNLCRVLWDMVAGECKERTTACISANGVPQIVAALRVHADLENSCEWAILALHAISSFRDGAAACLSANAVPHLLAARQRYLSLVDNVEDILTNLGVQF